MRPLGLIWDDLDLEGGFIRVRAPALAKARARLREDRRESAGGRARPPAGEDPARASDGSRFKSSTDFVLPAPAGGGLLHSAGRPRGVERAVVNAGLEHVTPYTFRHGFASMLIAASASTQ